MENSSSSTKNSKLLCEFAYSGDVENLTIGLHSNPSIINAVFSDGEEHGQSLLHFASFSGQSKIVDLLLRSGAKINSRGGKHGLSPLHMSVSGRFTATTRLLLENGANVNLRDDETEFLPKMISSQNSRNVTFSDNESCDHNSCSCNNNGNENINNLVIDYKVLDIGWTPLFDAVIGYDVECVALLLQFGASASITSSTHWKSPIHYAAIHNPDTKIISQLLWNCSSSSNSANNNNNRIDGGNSKGETFDTKITSEAVNSTDLWGNSPLHYAAQRKHSDICQILLVNGANLHLKNLDGVSPLDIWSAVDSVGVGVRSDVAKVCTPQNEEKRIEPYAAQDNNEDNDAAASEPIVDISSGEVSLTFQSSSEPSEFKEVINILSTVKTSSQLFDWLYFVEKVLKTKSVVLSTWYQDESNWPSSLTRPDGGCNGAKTNEGIINEKVRRFKENMEIYWNWCKSSTLPFEIVYDESSGQLSVISKSNNFETVKQHLFGGLEYPGAMTIERLKRAKFSHVFQDSRGNHAVIYGPIAFCRHSSASRLRLESSADDERIQWVSWCGVIPMVWLSFATLDKDKHNYRHRRDWNAEKAGLVRESEQILICFAPAIKQSPQKLQHSQQQQQLQQLHQYQQLLQHQQQHGENEKVTAATADVDVDDTTLLQAVVKKYRLQKVKSSKLKIRKFHHMS